LPHVVKSPERKISETLLDFADPVIKMRPPNPSEKDMRKALELA
jgi:hypothetical protein